MAIGNCGSTWLLMLPFALQFAYNETPAKFLLNATSFVAMALIAAGKFEVRERGVSFGIDSFLWRDIKSFQWRSGSKLELVLKQPLLPRANPDVSVHPDCAPSIHEALRNQLIEVTYD